jgi:hypothetical protein
MLDVRRREFITLLGGAALAGALPAAAQKRTALIGLLGSGSAQSSGIFVDSLKEGLSDGGLREGCDYVLDLRWAEGNYERFPALAAWGRWGHVGSSYGNAGGPRRVNKLLRAPAPSTLGHLHHRLPCPLLDGLLVRHRHGQANDGWHWRVGARHRRGVCDGVLAGGRA